MQSVYIQSILSCQTTNFFHRANNPDERLVVRLLDNPKSDISCRNKKLAKCTLQVFLMMDRSLVKINRLGN